MHNIKNVSLYERYELLELDRDAGVKTFEAREIATGRPVKVHLFVHPSAPLQAALLKVIEKLQGEHRLRIVDQGQHDGTPYVVTNRFTDYPGLTEWVQAVELSAKAAKPLLETARAWKVPSAPSASAPAPVSTPVTPPNSHLELNQKFTELFATAERPILADNLLQPPRRNVPNVAAPFRPPDPQPIPAAAPPQVKSEPGEFTRMFQSPAAAPATTGAALQPQTPLPAAATEPGEFTRMFQAPAGHGNTPTPTDPRQAAPSAATTKSGPGDFTRFFETPSPAGPLPQSPAVQQPLTPNAPGRSTFNAESEFTRTFGKPGAETPASPPVAAPLQEPGEFTRMFHSPAPAAAPGATAAQPQSPIPQAPAQPLHPPTAAVTPGFPIPPQGPAAPQSSGPGEYTRQFSAPAQLTFGQSSAASPARGSAPSPQAFAPPAIAQPAMPNMVSAPRPARKLNLSLVLGIVGIVLVAALLIVFFAMRPK